MQNYCKTIGALAAASALVAGNASAEVEYDLHTGYSSSYLWRGQDFGNDLVEVGANVKGEWNGIGLSAGAWYAAFNDTVDLNNGVGPARPLDTDLDELDLYAEMTKDFGFLTAGIGYIYYMNAEPSINGFFPAQLSNQDSQEVYFALSRDFGFAKASLTYFWDIAGGDNNGYTELALSRAFVINQCLTLNVASNLGYQFEEGQCNAWTTKVALDWAFVEHAKLSPFVALSIALSDDADSTYTGGTDNELVAGSMLSVSF